MARRCLIVLAIAAMSTACGGVRHVHQDGPGWVKLGTRHVAFAGDHDTLAVTGHEGRFKALRFEVSGRAMEMYDMKVTFGNGKVFSPNVRSVFRKGSWTRRIDLPGNARVIRRIDFYYRSLAKGPKRKKRQAKLHVFGLRAAPGERAHAPAASPPSRPPPPPISKAPPPPPPPVATPPPVPVIAAGPAGWVALGKRKVAFGGDHDTIMVTAADGRFRALEIRVKGSPLEMFKMKVTFGNGKSISPALKHFFRQGSWTRRLDLPGKRRIVRKVEFWYRSVGKRSGKATVKLFGQR